MSLLEVDGLHVRYGGVHAVRDVRLRVDASKVTVVLGPNGAGKTSTLRAICGLERKSSGRVTWRGQDVTKTKPYQLARRGLVLVPQGRRVFAPLTVEDNLLIGGYNRSRTESAETLDHVYSIFPRLKERRRERAGFLSGGEQQMLAFGRAMMARPQVILADEPSMGLSPAIVETTMESIAELARSGLGVLAVEQNAHAALAIAHFATVLERGSVVLEGPAQVVRKDPDVVRAFLGDRASG